MFRKTVGRGIPGVLFFTAGVYLFSIAPTPGSAPMVGDFSIRLEKGFRLERGPTSGGGNAVVLFYMSKPLMEYVERYACVEDDVVGQTDSVWFICSQNGTDTFLGRKAWEEAVLERFSYIPDLRRPIDPYICLISASVAVLVGFLLIFLAVRAWSSSRAVPGRPMSNSF